METAAIQLFTPSQPREVEGAAKATARGRLSTDLMGGPEVVLRQQPRVAVGSVPQIKDSMEGTAASVAVRFMAQEGVVQADLVMTPV